MISFYWVELPPQNSHVKSPQLVPQNMTIFGDKAFKEIIGIGTDYR